MSSPEPEKIQIDIHANAASPARSVYRRKKTPWWQSPVVIIGGLVVAAGLGWFLLRSDSPQKTRTLSVADSPPLAVQEMTDWSYQVPVKGKGVSRESLRFELTSAPEGVSVDSQSGELSWQPTEAQGPGEYQIGVKVSSGKLTAQTTLQVKVDEVDRPPAFDPVAGAEAAAGETATIDVSAADPDTPSRNVEYALVNSTQENARIDSATGRFSWTVPSDHPPGRYRFLIQAAEAGGSKTATQTLLVSVKTGSKPVGDPLVAALNQRGVSAVPSNREPIFSWFTGKGRTLLINNRPITIFRSTSTDALESAAKKIENDPAGFFGKNADKDLQVYRRGDELAAYAGNDGPVLAALESYFGKPIAAGPFESKPATVAENKTEEKPAVDSDLETLRDLYDRERLATADAYPVLRKLFADRFVRDHEDALQQGWGEDYDEMMEWLDKRPGIRKELFTAVDPKHDKLPAVFELFQTLREKFPDKFEEYAPLAIAVSVVWDEPNRGVVRYDHHAERTHSTMPAELPTGVDVFQYFLDSESVMQGRAKFLPWEFLVWMVNDQTPLAERRWAVKNYLNRRVQIGKCYKDVPYDQEMLRTGSQVCKLDGKEYVLPNIRQFGGVCAMQADFSSRVAKSLGVPAAHVRGESRGGELHAWVMWVELLDVNRNNIRFSLESYGRYRGDKYYVGTLRDAQTGQRITDRILERKLRVLGANPKAKRHADLAVRALELVDQDKPLTVKDSMLTVLTILKLCPGHAPSWHKLAELAGSDEIDREERRMMVRALESLFKTFRGFPDFTWKVFADLTRYEDDPRKKVQLYKQLLALYQNAGRPDLACDAAIETANLLVENDRPADAVQILAAIMNRFPDEGRYVPRMLDRMEEIYKSSGGASADLVAFYQKLIPKIPPKRGDSPSPYAMKMYERAINCFQTNNRPALAQAMSVKLAVLRAGM